jgi:hypothetical protein
VVNALSQRGTKRNPILVKVTTAHDKDKKRTENDGTMTLALPFIAQPRVIAIPQFRAMGPLWQGILILNGIAGGNR